MTSAAATQTSRTARQSNRGAILLIAPAVVLLLAFLLIPFLLAIGLSLTSQRLVSPLPLRFVGLENYARTLSDPAFWQALSNNVAFALVVPTTQTVLGLGLALMVNQPLRGITIFRTIYFMPVVMVLAVVSVLWRLLFAQGGMINAGIGAVAGGSFEVNWLHDPGLAFPAVMVASIWQNVGFQMILLLAGLQAIPADLYEAARVDGANGRQLFRHITLPGVRNTLIFVATVSVVTSFLLFDQPYVMTGGGPAGATQPLMLLMTQVGFVEQRIGQASAIAVIFFVIVLGVALISRRFGPRMTEAN